MIIKTIMPLELSEKQMAAQKYFHVEPVVCCCRDFAMALRSDGSVQLIDPDQCLTDFQPEQWQQILMLSAGDRHMVGLRSDGRVLCAGDDSQGQCQTQNWDQVISVTAGPYITFGITEEESCLMAGRFVQLQQTIAPVRRHDVQSGLEYTLHQQEVTVTGYRGKAQTLALPKIIEEYPVKHIGENAFLNCKSLTGVQLPEGIISIGTGAFRGCTALKSIAVPDSVTAIAEDAFDAGVSLVTGSSEYIHRYAASHGLGMISTAAKPQPKPPGQHTEQFVYSRLSDGSLAIRKYQGQDKDVTIPEKINGIYVSQIADHAFENCNFINSITIPEGVMRIGQEAFKYCEQLKAITLPQSVTYIGGGAFKYCGSLTGVQLPSHITEIHEDTFMWCKELKDITIPEGVVSIGVDAFWGCKNLKSISIPDSVISIGERAMRFCRDVIIKAGNDSYAHQYAVKQKIQFSPVARQKPPAKNTGTEQEASVKEFTFQKTRQNTVTILSYTGKSKNVIVPGYIDNCPVTVIGKAAFKYCETLESVTLPNTVTAISEDAFLWCKSLKEMQLPDSVQSIGEYAFWGCKGMTSVVIPGTVTRIGEGAFLFCDKVVIVTDKNSYAHQYAQKSHIPVSCR